MSSTGWDRYLNLIYNYAHVHEIINFVFFHILLFFEKIREKAPSHFKFKMHPDLNRSVWDLFWKFTPLQMALKISMYLFFIIV